MNTDELHELKNRVKSQLFAIPGVFGVAVGVKEVDGQLTDQIGIKVYVKEKKPVEDITSEEMIPSEVEGIPVDVVQRKFERHTITGGGSRFVCKPPNSTYGTVGLVVKDTTTGDLVGLTNNHVVEATDDEEVYNNGPSFVGHVLRGDYGSNYDAGVFAITDALVAPSPGAISAVGKVVGSRAPVLNEAVVKFGQKSNLTAGTVTATGLDLTQTGEDGDPDHDFSDQIEITSYSGIMSAPGDSGSVFVATGDKNAVGLLWGGDGADGHSPHAVGAPMDIVVSAMDVEVVSPKRKSTIVRAETYCEGGPPFEIVYPMTNTGFASGTGEDEQADPYIGIAVGGSVVSILTDGSDGTYLTDGGEQTYYGEYLGCGWVGLCTPLVAANGRSPVIIQAVARIYAAPLPNPPWASGAMAYGSWNSSSSLTIPPRTLQTIACAPQTLAPNLTAEWQSEHIYYFSLDAIHNADCRISSVYFIVYYAG